MLKNQKIKERLVPYRILAYLLYHQPRLTSDKKPWLTILGQGRVKLSTGAAARFLKVKPASLWETLWWLEKQGLVGSVVKEKKRGSVIVTLLPGNSTDKPTTPHYDNSSQILAAVLKEQAREATATSYEEVLIADAVIGDSNGRP